MEMPMIRNHGSSFGDYLQNQYSLSPLAFSEERGKQVIDEDYPILPEVYGNEVGLSKAGNAIRTRDIHLGKVTLYH